MGLDDDDLRPYMIHAEKVAEAEEGKTRVASTAMTFKREVALGMLGIYKQIAHRRELHRTWREKQGQQLSVLDISVLDTMDNITDATIAELDDMMREIEKLRNKLLEGRQHGNNDSDMWVSTSGAGQAAWERAESPQRDQ